MYVRETRQRFCLNLNLFLRPRPAYVIHSIPSALSQAKGKGKATPGSALTTTPNGKSFSPGFNLSWDRAADSTTGARERLYYMFDAFKQVLAVMISLPMPTMAMSHDFIVVMRDKGLVVMPEVDIGLTLPDDFAALFRCTLDSATILRVFLLIAKKMKGEEALRMGIVEAVYDSAEELVEASMRLAKQLAGRKWDGKVYPWTRKSLYPDSCGMLGLDAKAVVANSKL